MKYLTACYRQREGQPSLLLQHFLYKGVSVCVAGLLSDVPSLTGQLHSWFLSFSWDKEFKNLPRMITHVKRDWQKQLEIHVKDSRAYYAILLAVEDRVLLLSEGCKWFLVNSHYCFDNYKAMSGDFEGRIEPGAGILLGTKDFGEYFSGLHSKKYQILSTVSTGEQAALRLSELLEDSRLTKEAVIFVKTGQGVEV